MSIMGKDKYTQAESIPDVNSHHEAAWDDAGSLCACTKAEREGTKLCGFLPQALWKNISGFTFLDFLGD